MDDANGKDIWCTKLFWWSKDFFCHLCIRSRGWATVENNKNMIGNESESDNKRGKTFGFEKESHHRRLNDVDGLNLSTKFWSYLFIEGGMINLED